MQLCRWYEADQLAPDGVACGRASSAGAALGMPVAVAVVSARVLAEVEGSKGCQPARLLLTDPSTTLAASVPKSAPRLTCSSPLLVSIHSRSALAGQLSQWQLRGSLLERAAVRSVSVIVRHSTGSTCIAGNLSKSIRRGILQISAHHCTWSRPG